NLRVCGHAGRHYGPGGAHGGHVLPPHAWPQAMHAAREWVTMLALWSRVNLPGYGADTFQGPLVPHCRFQLWRTSSVRVFGVVHVKDSVETDRPILRQISCITPGATRPEQRERDTVATGPASQVRHDMHRRQFL